MCLDCSNCALQHRCTQRSACLWWSKEIQRRWNHLYRLRKARSRVIDQEPPNSTPAWSHQYPQAGGALHPTLDLNLTRGSTYAQMEALAAREYQSHPYTQPFAGEGSREPPLSTRQEGYPNGGPSPGAEGGGRGDGRGGGGDPPRDPPEVVVNPRGPIQWVAWEISQPTRMRTKSGHSW